MTKTDEIYHALSSDNELKKIVETVAEMTVISYDGTDATWCDALKKYLEDNNKSISCVKRIVLLGVGGVGHIWKDIVQKVYPDAEIVCYADTWKEVGPHRIYIETPFAMHFATAPRNITNVAPWIWMCEQTRLLFAALIVSTSKGQVTSVLSNLDSFAFKEAKSKLLSDFCVSKVKDMRRYRKELTPQSALKACVEEAKHGCDECCMVDNYGNAKICPLAQHEVALMYRQEDNSTSKCLSHQLDRLSAYQGFEPSQIQIADNMAEGCGCEKDIFAALSIYKRYAHNGNTTCCDRIIELADKEDSISNLVALPWIIRLANDGDLGKASELARIFEEGKYGVPIDHSYSRKWQTMIAESGDDKYIAELIKQAKDRQDWKEAIKWSRKLRDLDSEYFDNESYAEAKLKYIHSLASTPYGLYTRGKTFLTSSIDGKDIELAELCLIASAETGYLAAQEFLCEEYCTGQLPHDFKKSIYWGDKALGQGSKDVRFRVAWLRCGEGGVAPDYEVSHRLYKELAKEGNSAAMCNLGWMCENGYFFTVNHKKAVEWYLKSAEAGSTVGARNLAYMYKDGRGTERNYDEAFRWFLIAAKKEDKSAIKQVIECYRQGLGVEQDNAKVIEWYKKLIDTGDKDAIISLGCFYEGSMDDSESAIKYYRMAAEQDNSLGQYYLAEKYEHGEGVGEDINTAIYWYRKSAMNGDEDAKKKLQSLGVDWLENKDE